MPPELGLKVALLRIQIPIDGRNLRSNRAPNQILHAFDEAKDLTIQIADALKAKAKNAATPRKANATR